MNAKNIDEPSMRALVETIGKLGGEHVRPDGNQADFVIAGIPAFAYVKPGGERVRGSIFLEVVHGDSSGLETAEGWAAQQPPSRAGRLEVARNPEGGWLMRMLFERPLDPDMVSADDPLAEDCTELAAAWDGGTALASLPSRAMDFHIPGDPRDIPPRSAWLLLGDEASFPSGKELELHAALGDGGIHERLWTSAKQTAAGDLAFVYFTSPRKHIAFVTRAATGAFYDASTGVQAAKAVRDEQWWAHWTPFVPVTPIDYQSLVEYADGHFPLRGRSGVYLRPEMVDRLISHVASAAGMSRELERILHPVVGLADLPSPERMTVDEWRALAPGALPLEKHVEHYVVEPLARFTLPEGHSLVRQHRIGRRIADYAVLDEHKEVRSVIEVKLRVRRRQDAPWADAADFKQVQHYAQALGCPAALIDCSQIHLIATDDSRPHRTIERSEASSADLRDVGTHLARR